MISHLFNRAQNVVLVENPVQVHVRCYLMTCMMLAKPSNCFYKMICSAVTHALGSVS